MIVADAVKSGGLRGHLANGYAELSGSAGPREKPLVIGELGHRLSVGEVAIEEESRVGSERHMSFVDSSVAG